MTHQIRFTERTLASVRCACVCGWKAEVLTKTPNRQRVLNAEVAAHLAEPSKGEMDVRELERLRAALTLIATVEGEDDPAIMWPWAREIAEQALLADQQTGVK